jgi:hypothetical protein
LAEVQKEDRLMTRRIFPIAVAILLAWSGIALAVPVKFQWNASTGTVAGYRLYQGTVSGTYTTNVTVPGTGTTGTMDMDPAASRYVAATAYDSANRESAFSNEILCHPVVVTASAGGTVSPSGSFFAQNGKDVTLTVTPDLTHRVLSVTVDGRALSAPYVITGVSKRTAVDVQFDPLPPSPPTLFQVVQQIATALDRIDGRLAALMDSKAISIE